MNKNELELEKDKQRTERYKIVAAPIKTGIKYAGIAAVLWQMSCVLSATHAKYLQLNFVFDKIMSLELGSKLSYLIATASLALWLYERQGRKRCLSMKAAAVQVSTQDK